VPFQAYELSCNEETERREVNGTFDVSVTVHHWYYEINNQLDSTITVY